jgi:hypothetical protein
MNNARTLLTVLALVFGGTTCSALEAPSARADDGEPPVASISQPLDAAASLQVVVNGLGSVQGAGFNCKQTCSLSFALGERVAISAHEANGYRFAGWQRACGAAPQSHSCAFNAGDVHSVTAVFVPSARVSVLGVTPTYGVNHSHYMRKIVVQFDVSASSVVTYELRQGSNVVDSWRSSPFTGRSTRTIWVDDDIPGGAYVLGIRAAISGQVKSGTFQVVLPPPQV